MKKTIFAILAAFVVFMLSASAASALPSDHWFDNSWKHRQLFSIEHSKVPGDLADFPIMIKLDIGSIKANVSSGGSDLRFTDTMGNLLPYEIEMYDEHTNELVAWVKANISSVVPTGIYMYFGNIDAEFAGSDRVWGYNKAAFVADSDKVWSSYTGVYHMNSRFDPMIPSNVFDSKSSGKHNGRFSNGENSGIEKGGKSGFSTIFKKKNAKISLPSHPGLHIGNTDFTISTWMKFPGKMKGKDFTFISDRTFFKGKDEGFALMYKEGKIKFVVSDGIRNSTEIEYNGQLKANKWYYITVAVDKKTDIRLYLDGLLESTVPIDEELKDYNINPNYHVFLGNEEFNDKFTGNLDEVRFSKKSRSAGYILAEYNSMNSPSTFYSSSSVEDDPAPTFTAVRTGTNKIKLTFSEPVTGSEKSTSFSVVGASAIHQPIIANKNTVMLTTTGLSGTDGTPEVTYSASGGNVRDSSSNELTDGYAATAADGVAPTFTVKAIAPKRIMVMFSENVGATSTDGSGWRLAGRTITANTRPTGASKNMMLSVSESLSGLSPIGRVVYDAGNGDTADTSGNEVINGFEAVFDNTAPILENIEDKDINENEHLTFTATATDADIPANNLTFTLENAPLGAAITDDGIFTWTPTSAYVGSHNFTVRVTDNGAGSKSDSQQITIAVKRIIENNARRSSKGGCGSVPVSQIDGEHTKIFKCLIPGFERSLTRGELSNIDTPVTRISVKVKKNMNNVRITVKESNGKPSNITAGIKGKVFDYVVIDRANIEDSDIEEARIEFEVPMSWLVRNNIPENTVRMNRLSGNKWEVLPTKKTGKGTNITAHMAVTSGFSVFAITGGFEKQAEDPVYVPAKDLVDVPAEAPEQGAKQPSSSGKGAEDPLYKLPDIGIITGAVATALAAAAGFAILITRRRHSRKNRKKK